MYSDNGTNFVSASKDLATLGVEWTFIPPRSPNFGGLWEAAVKSAKHHLLRCLNGAVGNFEQYQTFFCQIEAILNSRPLCTKRTSPKDDPITPAHFLTGDSLLSLPSPSDVTNEDKPPVESLLRSFQNRLSSFWKFWRNDYLAQLQSKNTWKNSGQPIPQDTVVIIKEDNSPPSDWQLGRVVRVYPGSGATARVFDVQTKDKVFKRSIRHLIPLLPSDC